MDVYVLKRPWLDHFMAAIAGRFEARWGMHACIGVAWVCYTACGMWQLNTPLLSRISRILPEWDASQGQGTHHAGALA